MGIFRFAANARVPSTTISLPVAFRKALVHASLRGLRFILNCEIATLVSGSSLFHELQLLGEMTYILVAFTPTESEEARIVTDEGDAFAGIARPGAEITSLDPKFIEPLA